MRCTTHLISLEAHPLQKKSGRLLFTTIKYASDATRSNVPQETPIISNIE